MILDADDDDHNDYNYFNFFRNIARRETRHNDAVI